MSINWALIEQIIDAVPPGRIGMGDLGDAYVQVLQSSGLDHNQDENHYHLLLKIHEMRGLTIRKRFEAYLDKHGMDYAASSFNGTEYIGGNDETAETSHVGISQRHDRQSDEEPRHPTAQLEEVSLISVPDEFQTRRSRLSIGQRGHTRPTEADSDTAETEVPAKTSQAGPGKETTADPAANSHQSYSNHWTSEFRSSPVLVDTSNPRSMSSQNPIKAKIPVLADVDSDMESSAAETIDAVQALGRRRQAQSYSRSNLRHQTPLRAQARPAEQATRAGDEPEAPDHQALQLGESRRGRHRKRLDTSTTRHMLRTAVVDSDTGAFTTPQPASRLGHHHGYASDRPIRSAQRPFPTRDEVDTPLPLSSNWFTSAMPSPNGRLSGHVSDNGTRSRLFTAHLDRDWGSNVGDDSAWKRANEISTTSQAPISPIWSARDVTTSTPIHQNKASSRRRKALLDGFSSMEEDSKRKSTPFTSNVPEEIRTREETTQLPDYPEDETIDDARAGVPLTYGGPVLPPPRPSSSLADREQVKRLRSLEQEAYELDKAWEQAGGDPKLVEAEAISYWRLGVCGRVLEKWWSAFEEERQFGQDTIAVFDRIKLARLFSTWTHASDRLKRDQETARQVDAESALRVAFSTWSIRAQRKRNERLSTKIAKERERHVQKTVFRFWRKKRQEARAERWRSAMHVKARKLQRIHEQRLASEVLSASHLSGLQIDGQTNLYRCSQVWKCARMNKIAQRKDQRDLLGAAFSTWRGATTRKATLRQLEAQAVTRRNALVCRQTMATWVKVTALRVTAKDLEQEVDHGVVGDGFRVWMWRT